MDDIVATDADHLWKKVEMNRYINRIYKFIARETKCIRDSITPSVTRIISAPPVDIAALTLSATTDSFAAQDLDWYNSSTSWLHSQLVAPYAYSLSPFVVEVVEAKWTNRQWKLTKVSIQKWQTNPWWEQVTGMPTEFATDGDSNKLFLNFRSTEADTLKLTVSRLPLVDLVDDLDVPELKIGYHDYFINGVLWQMYSKQDSEVVDKERANDYYALFMKDIDEIKQQETISENKLRPNSSLSAFR